MSSGSGAALSYPIVQRSLANGLRVVASPDHGTPTVAVNLWYDVGSRDEQPGRTGFAHLFEHLMFQGSAHVPSGQHIGLLQAVGASVNATTWFDRTNYFETLPTGGLDLALWLEADRLGGLLDTMNQESLDNQREVVKEEKRQRYDNVPYGDVMERLIRLTFPHDHPYGHTTIGSMDDLNAATLEDVQDFFRSHYLPSNAVLSIVGDVEPEVAFERADTYFGHLRSGRKPAKPVPEALPPLTGTEREETTADVPAEAVYLTWRLPARGTPQFDALDLAFSILGHGQTSRLHKQLVRGAELAESSGATALGLIGGSSYGFAYGRARAGVAVEEIEAALVAEVDGLLSSPPSEQELRRAQAQFERHWLHELARVDSRADAFGEYATLHRNPALVNTRIAEVTALGLDDVLDAVASVLRSDQRATLVYRQEHA
jgi:predicted Zn-dependent peptidase